MARRFDGVPSDASGEPMLVARTQAEFETYLHWLADYLYRPRNGADRAVPFDRAVELMIEIESEIASRIWERPLDDYPPESGPLAVRHADIHHRRAISEVLSRIPEHSERVKLLERLYRELQTDMAK